MSGTHVWFDTSLLIDLESGTLAGGLDEVMTMKNEGMKLLVPKHIETEFVYSRKTPQDIIKRQNFLNRLGFEIDSMAAQVSIKQVRAWTDAATAAGLGHGDAKAVAHIRASAMARNIRNPAFMTLNTKDINKMRQAGVNAFKFEPDTWRQKLHVNTTVGGAKAKVNVKPTAGSSARVRLRAGLSPAGKLVGGLLLSLIPDVILVFANRAAAKEAMKNIQIKFIKEGFSRGVAAAVMRWTEDEFDENAKNRIDHYQIRHMFDPGGLLTLGDIYRIAVAAENYGVDVGYVFAGNKEPKWKDEIRHQGMSYLKRADYHFGDDPEALFEFEFIDKLAWAIQRQTDPTIGPAIKFD